MRALRILVDTWALAACGLAFGWPLMVSADPSDSLFKPLAIATLAIFLVTLAARLVMKARR